MFTNGMVFSLSRLRMEKFGKVDPLKQLGADTIGHAVDDLGSVLGRVEMGSEGPAALGQSYDPRDSLCDHGGIGISRFQAGKPIESYAVNAGVGPLPPGRGAGCIVGGTGIREMVRASAESPRHKDAGLNTETRQFQRVALRHRVHGRFRREIGCKERGRAASRRA